MDSSRKYCRQWSIWEGRSSTLKPSSTVVDAFDDCSISLAKIETHFFYNDCFIEENQIIKNIDSIKIYHVTSFMVDMTLFVLLTKLMIYMQHIEHQLFMKLETQDILYSKKELQKKF